MKRKKQQHVNSCLFTGRLWADGKGNRFDFSCIHQHLWISERWKTNHFLIHHHYSKDHLFSPRVTLSGRGSLFFAAASQPVHLQRVHSSGFCSVSTPALHSSLFLVVQFAYAVLMLWESIWEISIWIRAHIRECKRLPRWFVGSTRCNTHGNLSSGLQSI